MTCGMLPRITPFMFLALIIHAFVHGFSVAGLTNLANFTESGIRILFMVTVGVGALFSAFVLVYLSVKMSRKMYSGRAFADSAHEREALAAWITVLSYVSILVSFIIVHARYSAVTNGFDPAYYPGHYNLLIAIVTATYCLSLINIIIAFFVPILTEGLEWRISEIAQ